MQVIKCFQENLLPLLTDFTSRAPQDLPEARKLPTNPRRAHRCKKRRSRRGGDQSIECRMRPSLLLRQSVIRRASKHATIRRELSAHRLAAPSTDPTMDYSCVKKTKNVHCSIHIHKCNALQLKAGTFTFCGTCYCIHTYTNQESKPPSASCKVTEEEEKRTRRAAQICLEVGGPNCTSSPFRVSSEATELF